MKTMVNDIGCKILLKVNFEKNFFGAENELLSEPFDVLSQSRKKFLKKDYQGTQQESEEN